MRFIICAFHQILRPYIRRIRWVGHIARMEEAKCIQNIRKPQGKSALERHKLRWEDTIKCIF